MFYRVVLADRYFSKDVRYDQVDWGSLCCVVDAYATRLDDWYFRPARKLAEDGHNAFSVMALNCLLIDTLSQFAAGAPSSHHTTFKTFLRSRLPKYDVAIDPPISHPYNGREIPIGNVVDAIYHGFRCGILHEGHITPYGMIVPGLGTAFEVRPTGNLTYADGADCPSVVLNPLILLGDLSECSAAYLSEVKKDDPPNDSLRANFKKKFSDSFGVDVTAAV